MKRVELITPSDYTYLGTFGSYPVYAFTYTQAMNDRDFYQFTDIGGMTPDIGATLYTAGCQTHTFRGAMGHWLNEDHGDRERARNMARAIALHHCKLDEYGNPIR